jgi:F-type H+-transporting ATPase subunit 8
MPQLVPFYFFNELTYTFVIIATTVYILSKYILPRFVRLFLSPFKNFMVRINLPPPLFLTYTRKTVIY